MATPEEIAALDAKIAALAGGPKSVSVDGMTVQNQTLAELIAYRKFLTTTTAATRARSPYGRRIKYVSPGAV